MTEKEIKEMLADIINNGAEYEYTYKDYHGDYVPWRKYKLGLEIEPLCEYRKVEKWYVFNYGDNDYRIFKDDIDCGVPYVFEGSKEECEKWVKDHNKKTWLEEYLDNKYLPDNGVRNPVTKGIEAVCKKILKEVKNYTYFDVSNCVNVINIEKLEQIIKELGV